MKPEPLKDKVGISGSVVNNYNILHLVHKDENIVFLKEDVKAAELLHEVVFRRRIEFILKERRLIEQVMESFWDAARESKPDLFNKKETTQ